jgi:hypothetical protein
MGVVASSCIWQANSRLVAPIHGALDAGANAASGPVSWTQVRGRLATLPTGASGLVRAKPRWQRVVG